MSTITPLIPRQKAPALEVPTVGGGTWRLADSTPETFTMIVAYRGYHCPQCRNYLADLNRKVEDFARLGVEVVVVSSDDEERATRAKEEWGLDKLTFGYGLDLDTARAWGLYISAGIGKTSAGVEEPALFSEPGLFMVRPDGTLYFASVQTMPFARPEFGAILKAVEFVKGRDYPARGEVVDHTTAQAA